MATAKTEKPAEQHQPMSLMQKLQKIQYEMKAPKNLYNSYGKYSYRNAEGILEAFKPYGEKYGVVLTVKDDIELINDRVYLKATATLYDTDSPTEISNTAYAREPIEKKGMDDAMLTGATSSYARKYCLNGLFLLDDTKDADSDEYQKQTSDAPKKTSKKPEMSIDDMPTQNGITAEQLGKIKAEMLRKGIHEEAICKRYGVKRLEDLSFADAEKTIRCLAKTGANTDGD